MKRPDLIRLFVWCVAAAVLLAGSASAFRVMTWNLLNFTFTSDPPAGSHDEERVDGMRAVIESLQPDVIVCQEMVSAAAATYFLTGVLDAVFPGEYEASSFFDGPDTDNMCYWRSGTMDLVDQGYYYDPGVTVRYICEYVLRLDAAPPGEGEFSIFSLHLKAGSSYASVRGEEARFLRRDVLNDLASGRHFIVAGDFNVYSSSEEAYMEFLASQPPPAGEDNDGRCWDPLAGSWSPYAHTQSTRTANLGDGGSTGGLDDRFDLLLLSYAFDDYAGLEYLDGTYTAYGNDGYHYNKAIIDPPYYDPPGPATAYDLYNASDHLPVYADFEYIAGSDVTPPQPDPMVWSAAPAPTGPTSIAMTCQAGEDATPPVEYYFEETSGSPGGDDSGWITSDTYEDAGLSPNTYYSYRVKARDSAEPPNEGGWSEEVSCCTEAQVPGAPACSNPTQYTIDVTIDDGGNPAGTEFCIRNETLSQFVAADGTGTSSEVWRTAADWGTVTVVGLSPGVTYEFRVKARNADGLQTSYGPPGSCTTASHVYVDASATGAGDGTCWADAFNSIQEGVDAADEVWVAAGTYAENVVLSYDDKIYGGFAGWEESLDQRDPHANVTVIDGGGAGPVVSCDNVTGVVIDGFTITGGSGTSGGGIHFVGGSGEMRGNVIVGNVASLTGGGVHCESADEVTIVGNVISGNTAPRGGGLYVRSCQPLIERNRITGNTSSDFGGGICFYVLGAGTTAGNVIAGNEGEGVYCYLSSPTLVADTIAENTLSGVTAQNCSPVLTNDIIVSNGGWGIEKYGTGTLSPDYNDVWGNTQGDYYGVSAGPSSISADPCFADTEYHIEATSPCVDAGDASVEGLPAVDIDGDARLHDGDGDGTAGLDIGADETTMAGALSPQGWLHSGWNLFSVPLPPADDEASAVLDRCIASGNSLANNLFAYEPGAGYSIYPGGFTRVEAGEGYWLHLSSPVVEDAVGLPSDPQTQIPLSGGWNLLGDPHAVEVPWADCLLTDGAESKGFADAIAAGWVDPAAYYYEDGSYKRSGPSGADDDRLRPWYGYWLLVHRSGLQLVVPRP